SHPCAVCGGHAGQRRHRGQRCHGYLTQDGVVAFCARVHSDKQAGDLFRHFTFGPCSCGVTHSPWEDAPLGLRECRQRMNGSGKPNGSGPKPWTVRDTDAEMVHRYEDPETGTLLFELVRFVPEARERLGAKTMPRHEI